MIGGLVSHILFSDELVFDAFSGVTSHRGSNESLGGDATFPRPFFFFLAPGGGRVRGFLAFVRPFTQNQGPSFFL